MWIHGLSPHLLPCQLASTFCMWCEAGVQHYLVTGSIFHYVLAWVPLLKVSWLRPLVVRRLLASGPAHGGRGRSDLRSHRTESSEVLVTSCAQVVCSRNNLVACCQAKLQNLPVPLKFFAHTGRPGWPHLTAALPSASWVLRLTFSRHTKSNGIGIAWSAGFYLHGNLKAWVLLRPSCLCSRC